MKTFVYLFFYWGIMACSNDIPINESISVEQKQVNLSADEMVANMNQSFTVSATRGSSSELISYPTDFGGMYINAEGKLVVLVTGDVSQPIKDSYTLRTGSPNFILESCEYSYNELVQLKTVLEAFFVEEANWPFMDEIGWTEVGISNSMNRVVVTMDCKADKIQLFKSRVSSSSLIRFEQSSGKPTGLSTKEMNPGA